MIPFRQGQAGPPIDVTEPGRDVWRPAVAVPWDGSVFVAWTEKRDDDWDIFGRRYDPQDGASCGPSSALTERPGPDAEAVLATASDGTVWMAWQAWNAGQADILLAPIERPGSSVPPRSTSARRRPTNGRRAIAADKDGRVHVAFDTYQAGNYDVVLRTPTSPTAR